MRRRRMILGIILCFLKSLIHFRADLSCCPAWRRRLLCDPKACSPWSGLLVQSQMGGFEALRLVEEGGKETRASASDDARGREAVQRTPCVYQQSIDKLECSLLKIRTVLLCYLP